jgi:hypothetical protein
LEVFLMPKGLVVVICVLLLIPLGLALGCGESAREPAVDLEKVSEFEGGRLYKAGKIYVAQLNGNYKEMGRQYGELMKTQIEQFYDELVEAYITSTGMGDALEAEMAGAFALYPERIRKVFEGIEETSGMGIDKLMLLDHSPALPLLSIIPPQCSDVIAWGEFTGDGPLVFGRSYDYAPEFQDFNDTLTVVVFNPDDGSRSVATIVNAGMVGTASVFNDANLAMAFNDGSVSAGYNFRSDYMETMINNVTFMLDSSEFKMLNAALESTRPYMPLLFNVADSEAGYCFEETVSECKRRGGQQDGLMIATNHFLEPTWDIEPIWDVQLPADALAMHESAHMESSTTRLNNLTALSDKYKGKFNADVMKEIFDIPMDEGGPTAPTSTMYQFVTVPAELQLWVKAYDYQDWVLVDLGELFGQGGSE